MDVVFKEWMGLDIRWTEEGALEGACSLGKMTLVLAAWTANEWIQDGIVSNAEIQWMPWQFEVRSFALVMLSLLKPHPVLQTEQEWNFRGSNCSNFCIGFGMSNST